MPASKRFGLIQIDNEIAKNPTIGDCNVCGEFVETDGPISVIFLDNIRAPVTIKSKPSGSGYPSIVVLTILIYIVDVRMKKSTVNSLALIGQIAFINTMVAVGNVKISNG